MSNWRIVNSNKDYYELVNVYTGVTKKVVLCSDKQFDYINSMRKQLNKAPLKSKPKIYEVNKVIERLQARTNQQALL